MYSHSVGSKKKKKSGHERPEKLTHKEMAFTVALIVVMLTSRLGFFPVRAEDTVPPTDPQITAQTTTPDGTNGGDPAPIAPGDGAPGSAEGTETTIITGDATAALGDTNIVNTNIGDIVPSGDVTTTPSDPQTITNNSENDATVKNDGTANATTGENAAGSAGNATIVSGDAVATANVLNVVNTNIFNSTGFIAFLSNLFGSFDSVDLRSLPVYTDDRADSNTCTIFGCGNMNVQANITSSSTANIFNNIFVRAFSGGNTASTTGNGNGSIGTGDAFAAANVVNIANTNIVDSNYMMLVFNNYGDWNGDFIFPSSEFFENKFLGAEQSAGQNVPVTSASTTFSNENAADITTLSTTTAASGDNSAATGDGTTAVVSGDAHSTTNVLNQVNHNVYGGSSMAVIFRVHGNWNGHVFSLPPGVAWSETENGIAFWSDGSGGSVGFGAAAGGGSGELNAADATASGATVATDVQNTNTATIKNNVEVYALTGENKVETESGAATVKTGNAYAGTNVVNVVNTNLFGTNWILAIIDIFGDWTGNISFGQPDLWLGGWIQSASNPLAPHDAVEYHYTVANRGDTDATHVRLTTHVDDRLVYLADGGIWGNDGISWDLGTIPAGGSVDVTHKGEIRGHIPFGTTAFTSSASVAAFEPDANPNDNHEEIGSLAVYNPPQQTGPAGVYYSTMPKLSVVKTNSATTTVTAPSMVDYKVTVYNDSTGSAYNSVLVDTLKDEDGNVVHEETWDLGEVFPHEEINVSYSVEYNASTTSGVYTNYAKVKAFGGHVKPEYASIADSPTVSSVVTIDGVESSTTGGTNTPTVTVHVEDAAGNVENTSGVLAVGGIGNAVDEGVAIGGNSRAAGRGFRSNLLVDANGARIGRDRLPTVVDLHPLAVALPPSDTLASSLWGNQSAAAFSAVLGSPWLYGGLIFLFIMIVWYERRQEKV